MVHASSGAWKTGGANSACLSSRAIWRHAQCKHERARIRLLTMMLATPDAMAANAHATTPAMKAGEGWTGPEAAAKADAAAAAAALGDAEGYAAAGGAGAPGAPGRSSRRLASATAARCALSPRSPTPAAKAGALFQPGSQARRPGSANEGVPADLSHLGGVVVACKAPRLPDVSRIHRAPRQGTTAWASNRPRRGESHSVGLPLASWLRTTAEAPQVSASHRSATIGEQD